MPQIALEYTANIAEHIEAAQVFARIHEVVASVGGINIGNCKSRARRLDSYFIGDGDARQAFAHLEVRFLEGRSAAVKQEIGRRCLGILQDYFAGSLAKLDLQMTVEVADIDRLFYFKIPEGTFSAAVQR